MNQADSKSIANTYEPTAEEDRALSAHESRRQQRHPSPRVKFPGGGLGKMQPDHPDRAIGSELLMEALGTSYADFANLLLGQIAVLYAKDHKIDELMFNGLLAVAKGIQPRDEVEAMLAVQMTAIHMATMEAARQLARAETTYHSESAEKSLNRLARTFTSQMEALKRYRSKGEQRVIIERVTVNDGGQAIVGAVSSKGGGG